MRHLINSAATASLNHWATFPWPQPSMVPCTSCAVHPAMDWDRQIALQLILYRIVVCAQRVALRANDDETNTCREFTLGGIGQTSSGYAPNQRQQDFLQQPALIGRTAGGRRSFQRRLLRRLNFWTVPDAAHSRRKTSCASLGRSTALQASPERSARLCAARGFTRQRCRTGGVSVPQAPSKR